MTTVRYRVQFGRVVKPVGKARELSQRPVKTGESVPARKTRSDASAAQLLAMAHFVERALIDGSIRSVDHAVGILGVSRSRVSQILRLLDLSPRDQARLLAPGSSIAERSLRNRWQAMWGAPD